MILPAAPILALLAALGAPASAAQAGGGEWPGAEGPLSNSCFLPTAAEAEALLARGDEALARGRPDAEVLEAWHAALAASAPGDSVVPRPLGELAELASPWPDPDRTAGRRTEGVEHSVLRRLAGLAPERRAAWSARFAQLAEEELAAAGSQRAALAAVERLHPATPAAARAALWLADLELEEGRVELCALWLERARRQAELAGELARLTPALERRAAALAELAEPPPAHEAWMAANELQARGVVLLGGAAAEPRGRGGSKPLPEPGAGVQPGAAFFADGTAAVQTAERIHFLDPQRLELCGDVVPPKVLERAHWVTGDVALQASEPPGWPLLPLAHGNTLVCVQGRTVRRARNALVCFELEPWHGEGPRRASLCWALRGDERFTAGRVEPSGLDAEIEFQPGLARLGSQVFVQVRGTRAEELGLRLRALPTEDQVPSWLVAVDLATGDVRWQRFLAQGLPIARSDTRYGLPLAAVSAAQPLATVAGRLFAGTHLGAGALVEADGRLVWTLKNRRRPEDRPGFSGWIPPAAGPGPEGGAEPAVLWAPADGDHLYWLRASPEALGRGPLLHPPRSIGAGAVLIGGDAREAVVLAGAGREQRAAAWLAASGGALDAPPFAPGERATGHGLCSERRALVATQRGLWLFDRTRGLYAMDFAPLPEPAATVVGLGEAALGPAAARAARWTPGSASGSLWARDGTVLGVGPAGVSVFRAQ